MASPRILVTGGSGQVGRELVRELSVLGTVAAPPRADLDLTDPEAIHGVVRAVRPQVIVNAAAYTAVDRAESESDLCATINARAPGHLAAAAKAMGSVLVHYSTDYVFDGDATSPYTETDSPNPINVYGRTKLEGERAVESVGGAYLIFRTSWVYGTHGANFLRTIRRLAREREELRIVADQRGAPTWSRLIAQATAHVLRTLSDGKTSLTERASEAAGTYHLTASGMTSWHEFARAILDGDPARAEHRCQSLLPITTDEYPTPARRPRMSALDTARISDRFSLNLPDWREQLGLVLADLTPAS